jgi:acetoacetyl-CoA synthetase
MFPRPDFFAGARLNFAENLLFPPNTDVDPSATAVITVTERDDHQVSTSWADLREAVRRCSNSLRVAGLKHNDVVAGFVSNHVEALVAMLAAASIGAIWTGISPDNGVTAVLDRLVQIGPKVLFADNAMLYNGKEWSSTEKTLRIVDELQKHGLKLVVLLHNLKSINSGIDSLKAKSIVVKEYDDFLIRYGRGCTPCCVWVLIVPARLTHRFTLSNSHHRIPFTCSTQAARRVYRRLSFTRRWGH